MYFSLMENDVVEWVESQSKLDVPVTYRLKFDGRPTDKIETWKRRLTRNIGGK